MAEAARKANPDMEILHFADRDALMAKLPELLRQGDTILVKASHFMEYGKIVKWLAYTGTSESK